MHLWGIEFDEFYLPDLLVNNDKSSKFIVPNYNIYNPFTTIFTDSKVTEIYCLADGYT